MKFQIGQVQIDVQILNFTSVGRSIEWKIDFPIMGKKVQVDGHYTEAVDNPFQISVELWEDSHAEKSIK